MQPVGLRTSNTAVQPQAHDAAVANAPAAMEPVAVADAGIADVGIVDVAPAAPQPAAPKTSGHFDFAMGPRTELHEKFLNACVGRNPETGVVSVDLDDSFWSWAKTVDTNVLIKAYLDGGFLSHQQTTAGADYKGLLTQSGTVADLQLDDRKVNLMDAEHDFALHKLESYHDSRSGKFCGSLIGPSRQLQTEYAAGTKNIDDKGCNMKTDYAAYKRAVKFAGEIRKFGALNTLDKKNSALQKRIATDKNFLFTLAITMKRLEMAHNATRNQQA